MASAYSLDYPDGLLKGKIPQYEFEEAIAIINEAILEMWPCLFCFSFGYLCCLCTLGGSFFLPLCCISEAKSEAIRTIRTVNQSIFSKYGYKLELQFGCSTSWLALRVNEDKLEEMQKLSEADEDLQEDINNQQRANTLKAKIRVTFRDIDEGKSGCIKEKLFFDILALNNIKLSKANEKKIRDRLVKHGKIDYKEAISRLAPDLTSSRPFESEWTLRFGDSKQSNRSDMMSLKTLTRRILTTNAKDNNTYDAQHMKDVFQATNMATINEEETDKSQYQFRSNGTRSQTPHRSSRSILQSGMRRAKTPNRVNSVTVNTNANITDPNIQTLLQELGINSSKKKKDAYTYDHEDNYNIVNNQYFDLNSPLHYKTEDLKSKSQLDYPDHTSVTADDQSFSKSTIPTLKTNKNLGTYQTTKFQNTQSLKNMAEKYGTKLESIINILKQCIEAQIDSRTLNNVKMEYIRINKDIVDVEEFKIMFRGVLKKLWNQEIENKMIEILIDDVDKNVISYKKVSDLVDFYHYYPLVIKKDKNFSQELYTVLTSNKGTNHEFNIKRLQNIEDTSSQDLKVQLAYLWGKMEERFQKVANAFRFFDISSTGKISFSEFSLAVERLFLKISPDNLSSIFKYLDKNHDRFIDYTEFCSLCEEKRRDIDPFDESQSGKVVKPKNRGTSENNKVPKNYLIESERGYPSGRSTTTKKNYDGEPPGHKDTSFTYGLRSMPPENMDAILTNDYQKEWLEKQKITEMDFQKKKKEQKHFLSNILKPGDPKVRKLNTERDSTKYSNYNTLNDTPTSMNASTHRNDISFGGKLPRLTPSPDILGHKRVENSKPFSKLDSTPSPNMNRKMVSNEEYIRELKERKGIINGFGKDHDNSMIVNPRNIFREKSQSPPANNANNLSFTLKPGQLSPKAYERIELPQVNKKIHNRGESLTIHIDDRKANDSLSKKDKDDILSQYYTDKRTLKMKSPMNNANGGKSSRLNITAL